MNYNLYAVSDWKSTAEETAIKSSRWLQHGKSQVSLLLMTYYKKMDIKFSIRQYMSSSWFEP